MKAPDGTEIVERWTPLYVAIKHSPLINDVGWYARKASSLIEELSQAEAKLAALKVISKGMAQALEGSLEDGGCVHDDAVCDICRPWKDALDAYRNPRPLPEPLAAKLDELEPKHAA